MTMTMRAGGHGAEEGAIHFLLVRLQAPAGSLAPLADFYSERLGFEQLGRTEDRPGFRVRETRLELVAGTRAARPFYHFALLVPGNRFASALDWAGERAELLPDPETGEAVFDFSNWDALACYFHDPAGNIVELIAHRGVGETDASGSFAPEELLGFSELGLVGNPTAMRDVLERELALELWDGTVEEEGRLAFVGEKARTLILCPPGRPWLPTDRAAEPHPVQVVLSGPPDGEALLDSSRYVIRRARNSRASSPGCVSRQSS
jgi:catechol 2,3-dioxygenase-like lactoylglutathione lyase family enzyme